MLQVPAAIIPGLGHPDAPHPAGADQVVHGHLPGDPNQDTYRRDGPAQPRGRLLDVGLAVEHHKLMEAMRQLEAAHPLPDNVRIDDSYMGGERMGGKVGRGSENKIPFVSIAKMHYSQHNSIRVYPALAFFYAGMTSWARKALVPSNMIKSDGLFGFGMLSEIGFMHKVVISPKGKAGCDI